MTFCALGLVNSQLLDNSLSLSRRLQVIVMYLYSVLPHAKFLIVCFKVFTYMYGVYQSLMCCHGCHWNICSISNIAPDTIHDYEQLQV